ncbi:MAG: hypothetical protein EHM64_04970 [Ignavibacteriae bacterium]|nr:MAG: hypothetical protein EHM64_04970 [Ignavibacteriota bacterium]
MTFRLDSLVQQHERTKKRLIPFLNKMNIPYLSTVASTVLFYGKDTAKYFRRPFHDLAGIILFSPAKRPEFLPHHSSPVCALGRIQNYFLLHRNSLPKPAGLD